MASVFDKIRDAQGGEEKTESWWRQAGPAAMRQAFSTTNKEEIITREKQAGNGVRYTPGLGQIILFEYDAKATKDKLPYYDQLPVALVLQVKPDYFYAANLHYVTPKKRLKTISALTTNKIDVPRKCIHKYKRNDVVNRLYIQIDEKDWDSAMYLPIERFVHFNGTQEVPVSSKKVWVKYDELAKFRFRTKRKV